MKEIVVSDILGEAWDIFAKDFNKLCILAIKSYVLTIILSCVLAFIVVASGAQWLQTFGDAIALWFASTLFILAVHRYRLLEWNDKTRRLLRLRFGKREVYFLTYTAISYCVVAFLTISHTSLLMLDGRILFVLIITAISVVFLLPRFLLILPATADEQPHPISFGTQLGAGIFWKLFWVMAVPRIGFSLFDKYVILSVRSETVQIIFLSVTYYIVVAYCAIALCLLYKKLLNLEPLPTAIGGEEISVENNC